MGRPPLNLTYILVGLPTKLLAKIAALKVNRSDLIRRAVKKEVDLLQEPRPAKSKSGRKRPSPD